MILLDEFQFLPQDALQAAHHGPLPEVKRLNLRHLASPLSGLRWGREAPRFTFLHGAGLNAHTWNATILALAQPALALDLPGHGDSAWRDDADYRPPTLAAAVLDALIGLGTGPQVLVGQSLGGLAAIAVARQFPALVHSLVLVDITPGFRIGPAETNPVRDFLAGAQSFTSREAIVERALAHGFGPDRETVARGVHLNTRERADGRVVFKHHLAQPGDFRPPAYDSAALWEDLRRLEVPVALVAGTRGFLNEAHRREFRERVPGAALYETESGHNIQEERPRALAQAIAEFTRGDA